MHVEYMDNTEEARNGLKAMIQKHKGYAENRKNKIQELEEALSENRMLLDSLEGALKMMEEDLAELEATKED